MSESHDLNISFHTVRHPNPHGLEQRSILRDWIVSDAALSSDLVSEAHASIELNQIEYDKFLCRLPVVKLEPTFLSRLHTLLPAGSGVYFTTCAQSEDSRKVDTLAIVTPTRQSLYDALPTTPTSVLLHSDSLWLLMEEGDDHIVAQIEELTLSQAICMMEVFQWGVDYPPNTRHKSRCLRFLRRLAKKHQSVPLSFRLPELYVNRASKPFAGGGFSDVWKGTVAGQEVCVKVLRFFMKDSQRDRIIKDFCHETLLWRQFQHPNVLPFLGFNEELFAPSFCLVSPYLANGNILAYLDKNPSHEKTKILLDVATGMHYLHTFNPPIVHGDIRGANILVKDNLECCLADLGLSIITESHRLDTTSRSTSGGAARWMAPEVLDSGQQFPNSDDKKRDIYAFACTVLEVITGEPPFASQRLEYMVCIDVIQGRRPPRPSTIELTDSLWNLVEQCWQQDPSTRPHSGDLSRLLSTGSLASTPSEAEASFGEGGLTPIDHELTALTIGGSLTELSRLIGIDIVSLDSALVDMTRRIEGDPSDWKSWYYLGRLYIASLKYHKAYEAYQQAIFREGRNPAVWCSIGILYLAIDQDRDAHDAFSRSIRLHPYIFETWFNLGVLYESVPSNKSDAIDAYERANELALQDAICSKRLQILKEAKISGKNVPSPPRPREPHQLDYVLSPAAAPAEPSKGGKLAPLPSHMRPTVSSMRTALPKGYSKHSPRHGFTKTREAFPRPESP